MLSVLVAMDGALPWIHVVSIGCYGLMRFLGHVLLVLVAMKGVLPWICVVSIGCYGGCVTLDTCC